MADFILNEWVWAHLIDNQNEKLRDEAFALFKTIYSRKDRIIIVWPSQSHNKAWDILSHTHLPQREYARYIVSNILINSDICLYVHADSLPPLSDDLSHAVKDDDHYLVQALLEHNGSLLVTTDNPLLQILKPRQYSCEHRDSFVARYCA